MLINVNAEYPIPIGVIEGSLPILNEENPYWVEGEKMWFASLTCGDGAEVFGHDEKERKVLKKGRIFLSIGKEASPVAKKKTTQY